MAVLNGVSSWNDVYFDFEETSSRFYHHRLGQTSDMEQSRRVEINYIAHIIGGYGDTTLRDRLPDERKRKYKDSICKFLLHDFIKVEQNQ